MFRYHPRRVQQAGHSAEAWLASPALQVKTFARDQRRAAGLIAAELRGELGKVHAGRPATLSGLLAVAHAAGPEGLRSWLARPTDKTAYPNTTAAYLRATGAF